jgi:hypothetical protein
LARDLALANGHAPAIVRSVAQLGVTIVIAKRKGLALRAPGKGG